MRLFSLAFLSGILLLQHFSHLPDKKWIGIILIFAIPAAAFKYLRLPCVCALGFAWVLWYAHLQTSWVLAENVEGKSVSVIGAIASIPDTSYHSSSFLFSIKTLQAQQAHGLIRLSWRSKNPWLEKQLHVGDQWQLTVRLKKIHGLMNPGGFDYEAWALQEGIRARGYVVDGAVNKFMSSHWYIHPVDRVREFLKEKIQTNLPKSNTSPWIIALTVGERHSINQENWEVLRNTGTNHLMAIAGLHIGFMAGFAYALIAWFWRKSERLCLRFPVQHAGSVAALLMALIYSAMAGFSIPTQRACLMLTVFLLILLLRRKIIPWQAWSIALLCVLLINPLSVLTDSFWLSFGAVALIIYGVSGRLSPKGLWWKYGRIQWVIAIGLIPFSIWLFQQCSLVSFLANSVAIPWIGFLVVPVSLVGSFLVLFSSTLGGFVLTLADKILSVLWIILTWFSHLSWGSWFQTLPNHWILILASIGMIILFVPSGFSGRYLGMIWLLPLFFYPVEKPKLGEVWLTLLDVGQGLATVIQTQNHILVFDTGPKLSPSYDMGESVVLPFLRTLSAKQVDMLVVSHGDNDHIGGAGAILKRLPVISIKTSVPKDLPSPKTSYCFRGEAWTWDQVHFQFLYPAKENLNLGNDSSCVLRVSAGDKHILFTGDIEKWAENNLVANEWENLPADILVAPHHGSKTSDLECFIQRVHPQYVLFPTGYHNRYHFPHRSVVAKYDAIRTKKIDTAEEGAIQFLVSANKHISKPILYRKTHHRYWHD